MNRKISYFRFLLSAMLIFMFGACKKEIKTPNYIHIDSISLSTDPLVSGSNSSNIHDAWIYIDGNPAGAYELPATFPILAGPGKHKISVGGGILINGIAASRSDYAFYNSYETEMELKEGEVVNLAPVVTYTNNSFFAWKENFDSPSFTLERTAACDAAVTITQASTGDSFENGSAFINMPSGTTKFEAASLDEFGLPKNAGPIYLELNFKTNIPLNIGLITRGISSYYIEPVETLNVTSSWKKIYIYLTTTVIKHSDAGGHKIYFQATNDGSVANPQIFLDNIKLIY